jgi:hypothetical protein
MKDEQNKMKAEDHKLSLSTNIIHAIGYSVLHCSFPLHCYGGEWK